tara:strand:- start:145 stop:312 length:168 start_codon:yes stop_codon:yes gene_type:complete
LYKFIKFHNISFIEPAAVKPIIIKIKNLSNKKKAPPKRGKLEYALSQRRERERVS